MTKLWWARVMGFSQCCNPTGARSSGPPNSRENQSIRTRENTIYDEQMHVQNGVYFVSSSSQTSATTIKRQPSGTWTCCSVAASTHMVGSSFGDTCTN
eukprot:3004255-Pyramimonas_sp.AAC.1